MRDTAEFNMKRTEAMTIISTITAKFSTGEATAPKDFYKMNNGTLVDIIKDYYNYNPKGLTGLNEPILVGDVMTLYSPIGPSLVLFCG